MRGCVSDFVTRIASKAGAGWCGCGRGRAQLGCPGLPPADPGLCRSFLPLSLLPPATRLCSLPFISIVVGYALWWIRYRP